ncbi:peptidoglycan DD-metalloendopeptidase family protein [Oceaniserpentilla sp. 4NH20-0058]|uniref:peptidoglycan DD-metalloendopeptidase family protein n=1 Tax=Oceaniserpentilla sp. 4NH20-0058 TaxID=3127660 RepID=UPI0031067F2B
MDERLVQLLKCQKNHQFRVFTQIPLLSVLLVFCFGLTACTGFVSVEEKFNPVSSDRDIHIVQKSETLFALAWRYGWDYKALASANKIAYPYTIYPGQKLNIRQDATPLATSHKSASKTLTKNKGSKNTQVKSAYKTSPQMPKPVVSNVNQQWHWPAQGKVIAKFSTKAPANKGIDIEGSLGESVFAAGAGSVVYAGSGLLGYGNLVIIKHDDQFLSAYAHNKKLLVKENQNVKAGQVIAEIGSSGTNKVKLHFEIRHKGKPVDPLRYLPKAR